MDIEIKNYGTIFVVSFEAGAANVISSFLKNRIINNKSCYDDIKYCLRGPAKDIFEAKLGNIDNVTLKDINKLGSKTDIVFTGRSLVPDLERDAIRLAKLNKVKAVTFLDHWVNYEGGFLPVSKKTNYSEQEFLDYLPDEIVIGDAYADEIIQKTKIPYGRVRFAENEYFNDMKSFFKSKQAVSKKRILYLSEPIYDSLKKIYGDGNMWGFNEFDVVKDLVSSASIFKEIGFNELMIRLHPKESIGKFTDIVCKTNKGDIKIKFSKTRKLEEDIADASIVVGMESMGLVIALLAGKRVVSYLPKGSVKKCSLPHKELNCINDFSLLRGMMI
ncbi:MAG TPA: hypothetical protein ENN78_01730 [Candidatus Omnitrophica bacterium]|nr:hypothetical protein [Candidatus Omnitrophota bacterium]